MEEYQLFGEEGEISCDISKNDITLQNINGENVHNKGNNIEIDSGFGLEGIGQSSHTHGGAIGLFGLHFVKTGIVPPELGKFYSELFELRQTGDYDDWKVVTENVTRTG